MKKARLILSASMIALMGLSAVTFSSCSKDDDCAVGYTGNNCDKEIRTPMLGLYSATDVDDLGASTIYSVSVTEGSSAQEIGFNHLGPLDGGSYLIHATTVGTVSENGKNIISFDISYQTPDPAEDVDGNVYSIEGSGTYDGKAKEITIAYRVYMNGDRNTAIKYTGTWTQQ